VRIDDVVGLVVAVLLGMYLVVALLYPERLG
jgi:K+-transporting ATPase KdpF subunit